MQTNDNYSIDHFVEFKFCFKRFESNDISI